MPDNAKPWRLGPTAPVYADAPIEMNKEMDLQFRAALGKDLDALVAMLADDELGARREDVSQPLNARYAQMLGEIERDENNELIVVVLDDRIVGMLQLTFIPYLTHVGSWRCLIEGVRICSDSRGLGLGKRLLEWAIARALERGCGIVQLTTDKQRPDAIRFYAGLGFVASHEGMKLALD